MMKLTICASGRSACALDNLDGFVSILVENVWLVPKAIHLDAGQMRPFDAVLPLRVLVKFTLDKTCLSEAKHLHINQEEPSLRSG